MVHNKCAVSLKVETGHTRGATAVIWPKVRILIAKANSVVLTSQAGLGDVEPCIGPELQSPGESQIRSEHGRTRGDGARAVGSSARTMREPLRKRQGRDK